MTAAVAMTLPGSRALPGWWRDLGEFSPRRFWFAHLILHRLEALVEVDSPLPLTTLALGLLEVISQQQKPVCRASLVQQLGLDSRLADTLLALLEQQGYLTPTQQDQFGEITQTGHEVLQRGLKTLRTTRCEFCFADARPPVFLPLASTVSMPLPSPSGWRFDLSVLEDCIKQSDNWKHQHGFPREVKRLLWSRDTLGEQTWNTVPLDRPEQALLVLVESEREELLGFRIRPDNWTLIREPILQIPFTEELITCLAGVIGLAEWQQAWQAWCQQRSFPSSDVEACQLDPTGVQLLVTPPPRLLERLRQSRSEALRGETWLLAGSGRVRPVAQVVLVS